MIYCKGIRDYALKKAVYPAKNREWKKSVYPAVNREWKKSVYPAVSWELKKWTRELYSSLLL